MRKPTRKQGFGYVLLALVIILLFSFDGRFIKSPEGLSIGVLTLLVGYFTGLLALTISLLFSIYTFIISLPLISAAYGFISYTLAKIHYMLATFVFKKMLKRTRWYMKMRAQIKNSRAYRMLRRLFNKITRKMGLVEPHMLRLYEVVDCAKCKKKIPKDGAYCPYCGVKTMK